MTDNNVQITEDDIRKTLETGSLPDWVINKLDDWDEERSTEETVEKFRANIEGFIANFYESLYQEILVTAQNSDVKEDTLVYAAMDAMSAFEEKYDIPSITSGYGVNECGWSESSGKCYGPTGLLENLWYLFKRRGEATWMFDK